MNDTLTRAEVEGLLREALASVDERLSKLEQEVSRHKGELETHARSLGLLDEEVTHLKQQQAAQRGELEQEHGAPKRSWFVADRFQGSDHSWLESTRRDPVYGVQTPGDLGVVANEDAATQAGPSGLLR